MWWGSLVHELPNKGKDMKLFEAYRDTRRARSIMAFLGRTLFLITGGSAQTLSMVA